MDYIKALSTQALGKVVFNLAKMNDRGTTKICHIFTHSHHKILLVY
jgi:hypothetical protein